ncbi:MAG: hypothetical protein J6S82_09955, partial [Bacteroidales bacterium]|nr:hypothetical protein [Bacteroidales bacterium]
MKRFFLILATVFGCGCVTAQVVLKEDSSLKNKKIERAPVGMNVSASVARQVEPAPPLSTPKVGDINRLCAVSENGRWGMV